jgi:hypothetical protein
LPRYIFLFLWGWLLNGVLLKDIYAQTPNLWRTQTEMLSFFHWSLIGQALIVFAFVMIYMAGFAGGGVIAGIRLGILWKSRRSACAWAFTPCNLFQENCSFTQALAA